jgi:hypothetical protein
MNQELQKPIEKSQADNEVKEKLGLLKMKFFQLRGKLANAFKSRDEQEKKLRRLEQIILDREKSVSAREEAIKCLEEKSKQILSSVDEEIVLDIGGTLFKTTKTTLTSNPCVFSSLLSSGQYKPNKSGHYFLRKGTQQTIWIQFFFSTSIF